MSAPTVYESHNDLVNKVNATLRPGEEFNLRGIQIPHYEVRETALAACLGTLNIPFREPAPYTDAVDLDEKGNERGRVILWWLADGPRAEACAQMTPEEILCTRTEWLMGAWHERRRFEAEHPLHPFVAMRSALDARSFWLDVIDHYRRGRAILPVEARGEHFTTDKLASAALLKACGFAPIAFNGRAFVIESARDGVRAEQILAEAVKPIGATPAQWMSRVLVSLNHLLAIAKTQSVILRQRFDDQTLLLTADATPRTVGKFHNLL